MKKVKKNSLIIFFLLLGAGLTFAIGVTSYFFPLWDLQTASYDLEWTRSWLWVTVGDYLGAISTLGIIAILSEPFPWGWFWLLGFFVGGGPICCCYAIYRLWNKTLILCPDESYSSIHEYVMYFVCARRHMSFLIPRQ